MTNQHHSIWRVPGYKPLVGARVLSAFVIWIDFTLIFSLLTYHWNAPAERIGLTSALYGLPGLLLGPLIGKLTDRGSPVRVMLFSYGARALTSALLWMAPSLEVFTFLVLLKGLANLGSMPAEQILTRQLLPQNLLAKNIGLMTAIDQVAKISAPLSGALLASMGSPPDGFFLSCLLAACSVLCAWRLRQHTRQEPASNRPMPSLMVLIRLLQANDVFRSAFIASLILSLVLSLYDPLLALFLKDLGFPAGTFGVIVSCTAAGGIVAATVFSKMEAAFGQPALMAVSVLAFGSTVVLPGVLSALQLPLPAGLLFVLWSVNGASYALAAMSFGLVMQTEAAQGLLGTVSATSRSAQLAVMVSAPMLGSVLSKKIGTPWTFVLSGCIASVCGLFFLMTRRQALQAAGPADASTS
jgi:MFS family permease